MVVFPNAKINLGLNIIRKRPDGFHDLETIFYPIPFYDALESIPLTDLNNNTRIVTTGISIQSKDTDNLCYRAWGILRKDFPSIPEVDIHLHKAIPSGAGLGGGSADALFMLGLLNQQLMLGLDEVGLMKYALQLGSDCPFFIINRPCIAKGRGEELRRLSFSLAGYRLIIVNSGIHVSTKEAFASIRPTIPIKGIEEIINQPIHTWKAELQNDFESVVFERHPSLREIKDELYNNGAVYAAMTGSGSTIFGLFDSEIKPELKFVGANSIVNLLLG